MLLRIPLNQAAKQCLKTEAKKLVGEWVKWNHHDADLGPWWYIQRQEEEREVVLFAKKSF